MEIDVKRERKFMRQEREIKRKWGKSLKWKSREGKEKLTKRKMEIAVKKERKIGRLGLKKESKRERKKRLKKVKWGKDKGVF